MRSSPPLFSPFPCEWRENEMECVNPDISFVRSPSCRRRDRGRLDSEVEVTPFAVLHSVTPLIIPRNRKYFPFPPFPVLSRLLFLTAHQRTGEFLFKRPLNGLFSLSLSPRTGQSGHVGLFGAPFRPFKRPVSVVRLFGQWPRCLYIV